MLWRAMAASLSAVRLSLSVSISLLSLFISLARNRKLLSVSRFSPVEA